VDSHTITDIINDQDYDFIVDCTDNFAAKFLINDACVLLKKPFSHGGVIRFNGQTMTYVPGQGPCYRCIFEDVPPAEAVPSCKETGVFGGVVGTIGTIQATEAVKYILGVGQLLTGYFLTYEALNMEFRKIKINRNKGCAVCGDTPTITELKDSD
jgi:molybdopterin/thiamine biosynthesis adenylyltransferase